MSNLPRIRPINIMDDLWNASTIVWGAVWAAIFNYVPRYLWKNRELIANQVNKIFEGTMYFPFQLYVASTLSRSLVYHNISRKPYTESELAQWREMGILFRKTKYGYVWRNAN